MALLLASIITIRSISLADVSPSPIRVDHVSHSNKQGSL